MLNQTLSHIIGVSDSIGLYVNLESSVVYMRSLEITHLTQMQLIKIGYRTLRSPRHFDPKHFGASAHFGTGTKMS